MGEDYADRGSRDKSSGGDERDRAGDRLLYRAREQTGTIAHVQDAVKNGLGGGHRFRQHSAVKAAWFKLALLAYNLASAITGLCFSPEKRTVRFKKYRLPRVRLHGRMSRNQCQLRLRLVRLTWGLGSTLLSRRARPPSAIKLHRD